MLSLGSQPPPPLQKRPVYGWKSTRSSRSLTNLQERAAVVALFHEDLENGYPGYGQDGTQRQYQTDGVCPAGEHVVSVLGGAEVDTGEDQNHL